MKKVLIVMLLAAAGGAIWYLTHRPRSSIKDPLDALPGHWRRIPDAKNGPFISAEYFFNPRSSEGGVLKVQYKTTDNSNPTTEYLYTVASSQPMKAGGGELRILIKQNTEERVLAVCFEPSNLKAVFNEATRDIPPAAIPDNFEYIDERTDPQIKE